MIILDTNIWVNILRKNPKGAEWLNFLRTKSIALTSITTYELFLGAELSNKHVKNLQEIQKLIGVYPVLDFDIKSSYIASKIQAKLQKQGRMIDIRDLYIAAIALIHNLPVATDNVSHFKRVEGLKVITI